MAVTVVKMMLWTFNALWLWICLTVLLKRLGLPFAVASAALLGWIGAGLSLPWILPAVVHWVSLSSGAAHWLLTIH